MKPHQNPFLHIAASLALLGTSAHAADVTLSTGTYTDTQSYNNGTISGVVTFDSGADYTFDSLNLPLAWNRVTLNSGASLTVAGNLSVDVSGVSLNGGTLTTGGLLLHDGPDGWVATYNDGKQTIQSGDSIINGATIVANQSNANFISLASSPGGYGWAVANNLWLGNDGATIDSGIHNIGITMALGNFSGQSGKLTKTGSGTLTLSAANTYSGTTRINAGTLILANANALQNSTLNMDAGDSGTVTFNQNSTLGGLTGSRALNMGGYTLSIGNNGSSNSYAGDLSNGTLIKTGGGTLTLSGNNTYSGNTSITGGTLRLDNTSALGTGVLGMTNNTTLQLRSDTDATFAGGNKLDGLGSASITIDVNQLTSGNSNKTLSFATGGFDTYNTTINVTGGNGYTLAMGGINNGYNGALTLNADTANLSIGHIGSSSATSSLNVGGSATTTITGAINTSGNFTKSGSGTLNLTGTSSFASVMIFEGGVVNASTFANNSTNSSLGAGTGDTDPNAIGLLFRGGTLQYTGSTAQSTDRAIRLSTTGGGGIIDASGSNPAATLSFTASSSPNLFENYGNRTLTLTGTNTGNNTFAMAITEAGTTSLVKSGAGKWVLTGTSNYSGATSVNEGTLVINGDHSAATSAVTVASGATLGGTGTIGGTLTTSGTIAPGNSIGTLSAGTTTWNGGDGSNSIWDFELGAGNTSDKLAITGDFLKGTGSTFKFDFMGSNHNGTFSLVTWTGTTDFDGIANDLLANDVFTYSNLGGGRTGSFSFSGNSLTFTAVPEPTSALAGLLITAGLLRRRR